MTIIICYLFPLSLLLIEFPLAKAKAGNSNSVTLNFIENCEI